MKFITEQLRKNWRQYFSQIHLILGVPKMLSQVAISQVSEKSACDHPEMRNLALETPLATLAICENDFRAASFHTVLKRFEKNKFMNFLGIMQW